MWKEMQIETLRQKRWVTNLLCNVVATGHGLEIFCGIGIVLSEFLYEVTGNSVARCLLNSFGHIERFFRRKILFSLSDHVLDEFGEVITGNRNVLDGRWNNSTIRLKKG